MYLRAKIDVDPRSVVHRERTAPTDAFGKLLHYVTAKQTGDAVEVESFTRVSMLQQLRGALESIGVANVVRFAVDGIDVYNDKAGTPDDLTAAVGSYIERKRELPPGAPFATLRLVVEHLVEGLRCLVEVSVQRTHAPGEDPVSLRINAVVAELSLGFKEGIPQLAARMGPIFADSAGHAAYVEDKRAAFGRFIRGLENAVCGAMEVDSVQRVDHVCLVRPFGALQRVEDLPLHHRNAENDPLFFGYRGFTRASAYAWLWLQACRQGAIEVARCRIVDERGLPVADVGDAPIAAATHPLFGFGEPVEVDAGEGVTVFEGHAYAQPDPGS